MATKTFTAANGSSVTAETYVSTGPACTGKTMVDIGREGQSVTYVAAGLFEHPHPHAGIPLQGMGDIVDGPTVDAIRDWLFEIL